MTIVQQVQRCISARITKNHLPLIVIAMPIVPRCVVARCTMNNSKKMLESYQQLPEDER